MLDFHPFMSMVSRPGAARLMAQAGGATSSTLDKERGILLLRIEGTLSTSKGGANPRQMRAALKAGLASADVAAILLAIDSPGGSVAGIDNLAEVVGSAGKPVWAQVEDIAAGSGYWAISGAGKIFANGPTALVGGVGIRQTLYDTSKQATTAGVKALVFSTGVHKGAGVPGSKVTQQQRDHFQTLVDGAGAVFWDRVQAGRRLTDQQMRKVFTGRLFVGDEAVKAGLIDGVQPIETTINQLVAEARKARAGGGR